MFGFFKKKPAPRLCYGNPGMGFVAEVECASHQGTWVEKFNLVSLAIDVMKRHGHSVANERTWLRTKDTEFSIVPQFVDLQPMENGIQTTTTLQTHHPKLAPKGIFEYQHSAGNDPEEAFVMGFDQWVQTDFVTLLDASRKEPRECTSMEMKFPAEGSNRERVRRAILGPVAHFMEDPLQDAKACADEEHPFCPCCLLTNSMTAFKDLLDSQEFCGMRLFAAREEDGTPMADCRVNGRDFEAGAEALRAYAATWPKAGYEFRKQYVVLQSV